MTLGLYRNRSVERIKGNQATFNNSQRNNLRSWWVSSVVFRLFLPLLGARKVGIYRRGVGCDLLTRANYSSKVDEPPPERGPV